ncbi:Nucleolysin TIAR [Intoshia linei]|uniref:Nucleolysin TIAR n=1 Tax=Intoshia linei TaxID=1819745 RepID=A0A177AW69_9BILA|nr:Nucleolysin TIAR [Intoshia linei]
MYQDDGQPKTLYVGNLHERLSEQLLMSLFMQFGACTPTKIIRDGTSDPYCFITYQSHQMAASALASMNKRNFYGMEIKVNWATSPTNLRKLDTSQHHHVYVGDLSPDVDQHQLHGAFAPYGDISNVKIIRDINNMRSKGYGFVTFIHKSDAEKAIVEMNGQWLGSKSIKTNWATGKVPVNYSQSLVPKQEYSSVYGKASENNTTVYVGGLNANTTEDHVKQSFAKYGTITDIRVFRDRGYAFCKYDKKADACTAIVEGNGNTVNGMVVKCSWGKETFGQPIPPTDVFSTQMTSFEQPQNQLNYQPYQFDPNAYNPPPQM